MRNKGQAGEGSLRLVCNWVSALSPNMNGEGPLPNGWSNFADEAQCRVWIEIARVHEICSDNCDASAFLTA